MSSHKEYEILNRKIITPSFVILSILTLVGFYFIGVRFFEGIGAVSNLSDAYPWGIWIAYDVATGTAIACGGYAVAILVYILNNNHYHPLMRSAMLTSLFGYGLAGFSVVIDLGRFWNMFNLLKPQFWQLNSIMFEVAMCVMTYTFVLFLEFSPAIFEKLQESENYGMARLSEKFLKFLDKYLIYFIILGITLPTMHQSSLGSMMIIAAFKLHPNWHTPILPLLFLINCIFIGYSIVIFESITSSFKFERPYETSQLAGLGRIGRFLALGWIVIRLTDLFIRNQLMEAFSFDYYSVMFLIESALIVLGSVILMSKHNLHSPRKLFISACLIVLGGGLYRFNTYIIGFDPGTGFSYFPAFGEFMITVGIVSFEILLYSIFVKIFPVLPAVHKSKAIGGNNV